MNQKLAITDVKVVKEPEPAIFEIVVTLDDGTDAVLRLSVVTLRKLARLLKSKLIGKDQYSYGSELLAGGVVGPGFR